MSLHHVAVTSFLFSMPGNQQTCSQFVLDIWVKDIISFLSIVICVSIPNVRLFLIFESNTFRFREDSTSVEVESMLDRHP